MWTYIIFNEHQLLRFERNWQLSSRASLHLTLELHNAQLLYAIRKSQIQTAEHAEYLLIQTKPKPLYWATFYHCQILERNN